MWYYCFAFVHSFFFLQYNQSIQLWLICDTNNICGNCVIRSVKLRIYVHIYVLGCRWTIVDACKPSTTIGIWLRYPNLHWPTFMRHRMCRRAAMPTVYRPAMAVHHPRPVQAMCPSRICRRIASIQWLFYDHSHREIWIRRQHRKRYVNTDSARVMGK